MEICSFGSTYNRKVFTDEKRRGGSVDGPLKLVEKLVNKSTKGIPVQSAAVGYELPFVPRVYFYETAKYCQKALQRPIILLVETQEKSQRFAGTPRPDHFRC